MKQKNHKLWAGVFILSLALMGVSLRNGTAVEAVQSKNDFCNGQPNKQVTICHATSSDTNPYVKTTVNCHAAYTNCSLPNEGGNAGHFCNRGTTTSGHEDDYILEEGQTECRPRVTPIPTAIPSPSVSPAVTPTTSPVPTSVPTSTPAVTPSVEPTDEPEVEPTDVPEIEPTDVPPAGKISALDYDIDCESSEFWVTMTLTDNDEAVKDTEVTFKYNTQTVKAKTNDEGWVTVDLMKAGDHSVTASADGFSTQSLWVTMPTNCEAASSDDDEEAGVGGLVLGESTEDESTDKTRGQVLGANSEEPASYASTGSAESVAMAGTGLFGTLLSSYALFFKKN